MRCLRNITLLVSWSFIADINVSTSYFTHSASWNYFRDLSWRPALDYVLRIQLYQMADDFSASHALSGQRPSDGVGEGSSLALLGSRMNPDLVNNQMGSSGHVYPNVTARGNSRVHVGNQIAEVINNNFASSVSQTRFKGKYVRASLKPVTSYVSRPALETQLKEMLHDTVEQRDELSKIVVVYGLGGAGKSQLMLRYIKEHGGDYSSIFWLDAGTKERLENDYKQIHNLLLRPGRSDIEIDTCIAEVKAWCHLEQERLLFVIDSADTIDDPKSPAHIDLRKFIVDAANADVVITTRDRSATRMASLEAVQVAEMDIKESRKLFLGRSKLSESLPGLLAKVDEITEELGHFALAVNLAASHITQTSRFRSDPSLYLLEYRKRRNLLLEQRPQDHTDAYSKSILAAWETTYDAINQSNPQACKLLSFLAFLSPQDILCDFFETADEASLNELWAILCVEDFGSRSIDTLDKALGILKSYSLVQDMEGPRSYSMHDLVHAWSYERLESGDRNRLWLASLRFLVFFTKSVVTGRSDLHSRLISHVMSSFDKTRDLCQAGSPAESEAVDSLHHLASFLHRKCVRFGFAFAILIFNHQCYHRLRKIKSIRWLDHLTHFGHLQLHRGMYSEAEGFLQQALFGLYGRCGSIKSTECATALVQTLGEQGKSEQAEALLAWISQEVQSVQARPEELFTCMRLLGSAQLEFGKYSDAENTFRFQLHIGEEFFGLNHQMTWYTLQDLANAQRAQRKYDEAQSTLMGVVHTIEADPGLINQDALRCLHQLGWTLADQGNLQGAENIYRRILDASERAPGLPPLDALPSMLGLASLLHRQGSRSEALGLYQRVFQGYVETLGAGHLFTVRVASMVSLVRSEMEEAQAPPDDGHDGKKKSQESEEEGRCLKASAS